MFEIITILGYAIGVVVGGACLAPPLWWLGQWAIAVGWLPQLQPFAFDKYLNRAVLLAAVVGMPLLLRRLRLRSWATLGLLPNPRRGRDVLVGLAVATGGFAILVAALLTAGHLQLRGFGTPRAWCLAAVGAIAVAVVEEIFFRGVLLGVLRRSLSAPSAVAFLSVFFAALHYLRPNPAMPRPQLVQWTSGFALLPHLAWEYGQPQRLWACLLTLTVMAAVLCYTVLRTQSLYLAMGLHAGWVLGVKGLSLTAIRRPGAELWVGDDWRSGLAPLGLMLGTATVLWAWLERRPQANGAPAAGAAAASSPVAL